MNDGSKRSLKQKTKERSDLRRDSCRFIVIDQHILDMQVSKNRGTPKTPQNCHFY